jgi:hypothetical protein
LGQKFEVWVSQEPPLMLLVNDSHISSQALTATDWHRGGEKAEKQTTPLSTSHGVVIGGANKASSA